MIKTMRKFIITLILIGFSIFDYAQNTSVFDFAKQKIKERGEIYFSFEKPSKDVFVDLCKNIAIDNVKSDVVYAYANSAEFSYFLSKNIPFVPVYEYYNSSKAIIMATSVNDMLNWDAYPTFAVYCQMMQNFTINYPNLCRLDTIGFSAKENRPILCVAISANISQIEDKPEFFWSSSIHGDETTGIIMTLRFADYLMSNYGNNAKVDNLVNNAVIYICPMANPDGTFRLSSNGTSISNATRYNGNNKDLNRSFPLFPGVSFDPSASPGPNEAEVKAMVNYANLHNFVMSTNLHGGATVANYPWDAYETSQLAQPDEIWWQYVAHIYADNAIANGPSNYFKDVYSSGVTEGGDWYIITGSRQDYMNYYKHCREMTLEISTTKKLGCELLNNYWDYNRQAMLDLTEQVLFGFRGIVTDLCTGQPLTDVKIEISGRDTYGTEVYSFAPLGNYFRPIEQGTYNVTFSKAGYISKTLAVSVTTNKSTKLDVALQNVTLNLPSPIITNNSNCGEAELTISAQGTGTLRWYDALIGGNLIYSGENYTNTFSQTSTYYVEDYISDSCISVRVPVTATIYPTFSLSETVEYLIEYYDYPASITININGGTPDFHGMWSNGETTTSSTNEMTIHNLPNGIYAVTVTDENACMDSINNIIIENPQPSNVFNVEDDKILIYQNPLSKELSIINAQHSDYQIIDVVGRIVKNGKINGKIEMINTSDLFEGLYFIKISNHSYRFSQGKRI